MEKPDILLLFDYNYWATARVLAAATRLTPEQFTAPAGLSHGSLRGALVHILGAEVVWRLRCQEGISPSTLLAENDFPTLEALRAHWQSEENAMRAYLAAQGDDDFMKKVGYKTTKGIAHENVLWQLLVHVVNHGTQFRSEAGIALTAYGCSPGDMDFLGYLRELAG